MARATTYRENELFHAAPYLKMLKGDRDDTNALARIETIFKLYEATITKKYAFLRFRGFVENDIPAELEVYFDTSRSRRHVSIEATVGEYSSEFHSDNSYIYRNEIDHLLDWVKTVIPYKNGTALPEGVNSVLDLWVETPEGEKFYNTMAEFGFSDRRKQNNNWYHYPFDPDKANQRILPLVYSEDYDHFKMDWEYNESMRFDLRAEMRGKEPVFFFSGSNILDRMKEYGFTHDERLILEYDSDKKDRKLLHEYGLSATETIDVLKSLFKFNEERLDKISAEHGNITWRGIDFRVTTDKFEHPSWSFSKLPLNEQVRINERINKRRAERLAECEEFMNNSKFKSFYNALKEIGAKISTSPHQYGDEYHIEYRLPVTIEVPSNKDRTLSKKTFDVTGEIWVSTKVIKKYWCMNQDDPKAKETYSPDAVSIYLPFHYVTDQGKFPSWDEAIKAGSNTQYGGQCDTSSNGGYRLTNNEYHHDYAIEDEELAKYESIIRNIEASHERFLVDCHYKDAPNG